MPTLPAGAHIGSVTLAVADIDRSTAFYPDILGFDAKPAPGGPAGAPRQASLSTGGRFLVGLVENPKAKPKPRRSAGLFRPREQWPRQGDRILMAGAPPPPDNSAGLVEFTVLVPDIDFRDARRFTDDATGTRVLVYPL
jgi:catechol 2,3-dioxygenase-like lactoylglutathione lyase family enzyme